MDRLINIVRLARAQWQFVSAKLQKKAKSRLNETFQGLVLLKKLPAAIFLLDADLNSDVIYEANTLNIPIIAIVDNNNPFIIAQNFRAIIKRLLEQ